MSKFAVCDRMRIFHIRIHTFVGMDADTMNYLYPFAPLDI